jgi:glycerol-3-phosphate acyltransferase PlsY
MTWIDNLHFANLHQVIALCLTAYTLGCFAIGYYLVRFRTGKDLRDLGSGSIGARNVGRVLGKGGFFVTVLFDFGKGALAVAIARHFTGDDRVMALASIAVVAGHIWPVQLHFRGGKGMATSLGCLLAYDPRLAVAFVVFFLCLLVVMRKTVLPGLVALLCVPLTAQFLDRRLDEVIYLAMLAGIVLLAHRKNIFQQILQLIPHHHQADNPNDPDL